MNFSAAFAPPVGLHPTLQLNFPKTPTSPDPLCALHAYLTLPSAFFVDKYQLSSPNFLALRNLRALRALTGETDLEAPDWLVSGWGSTVLLELITPPSVKQDEWSIGIPLHLRYTKMSKSSKAETAEGQTSAAIPWPIVFWACPANRGTKMKTNPFDRVSLGYDGLFGPRTMFHHLQPSSNESLGETVLVPVLDVSGAAWVERGTVSLVILIFTWICWVLPQASSSKNMKISSVKAEKED